MSDKAEKGLQIKIDGLRLKCWGEYAEKPLQVELECAPANALTGMKRALLTRNGGAWFRAKMAPNGASGDDADDDAMMVPAGLEVEALLFLARVTYPDLVAGVKVATGLDLDTFTLDEFIEIPEPLLAAWEEITYRANPHWLAQDDVNDDADTQEKKEQAPDSTLADE